MLETEIVSSLPRYKILLVDDEPASINLLTRTFRKEYDLHTARDGIEGLNIVRSEPIDLIISDQRMPNMTGVEMLSASRKLLPHTVRIILTAYSDVQDIIAAVNEGQIYRYNLKPWTPSELKLVVTQALNHYSLEKANRDLVDKLKKSLSDLKEAQDELVLSERMSAIGSMASTVIHDLKLPMSNIRTSAALLGRSNLDDATRAQFSGIIISEVDRLIDMTQEILVYSRGESKLESVQFLLDDFMDDICDQISLDFQNVGVSIIREWSELGEFTGDQARLRRALLNLAVNAKEAMPNGGELKFAVNRDGIGVVFVVSDSGPGIPEDLIDTLFDPFVTHGKHDGTGLGLAIAKRIVLSHRGEISAINHERGGAEFRIVLPN